MARVMLAAMACLTVGLSGCAAFNDVLHAGRSDLRPAGPRNQVAVFDGHEIWVDYACDGGATLRVRYLGGWADATLANGAMVRLARTDAGGPRPNFENAGYRLSGPGLSPTWTTPAGAAQCNGSLA